MPVQGEGATNRKVTAMTEQQIPTSEVLNRAADLIEERGWVRGPGWNYPDNDATQPLCLEGGVMAAQGWTTDDIYRGDGLGPDVLLECPAYRAVMDYLRNDDRWDDFFGRDRAYNWNDVLTRTAAEVIEVLRAAAAIEAARESDGRGTGERVLTAEAVAS